MTAPANTARRVVLRRLAPKCAERTAMLSPGADIAPCMGYRRGMTMPADALGVVNVIGVDDWTAYGRTIYIEQGAVDPPYAVIYTADVTDLAPHVQAAVDAREAWDAFEPDSGDPEADGKEEVRIWNAYKAALAVARAEDTRLALEDAA